MSDPVPPARPRPRWKLIAAILFSLLLIYLASPYYSVWRFGESLRAHDMQALASRVDFAAVRSSLKHQIREKFLSSLNEKQRERLTQFLKSSESDPLDQLIDAYVTAEGLAALIADPSPVKTATSISSLSGLDRTAKPIDWSKFGHATFTGPRDFAVEHEGIKLRFRFNGFGWKLHELDLELKPAKN